jgi:pimeloyl-ACP methyl ester carboxylesterase
MTVLIEVSVTNNAPLIMIPPLSQTVQVGSNVTFSVLAGGQPLLKYQWWFNGQTILNATNNSLSPFNVQFTNAGGYSVIVTNAYGSVTSAVAQLTVFTNLVFTQTNRMPATNEIGQPTIPTDPNNFKVLINGSFQSGVALNTNRMTIVLTHGFMSSPDGWATNMAALILAHVSVPTPNIVAWDWSPEAGSNLSDLPYVATKTLGQGYALGTNLLAALGTNYSQRIHFIGHSLGTLVNSASANYLHGNAPNNTHQFFNPTNTQTTLFDEAEAAPEIADALVALQNHQQVVRIFYDTPIPARAAWIDNYISAFGLPHAEAANVILTKGAIFFAPDINSFINDVYAFHGYPCDWYDDSVTNPASGSALMGYRWSFEQNNLNGMPATNTMFIQIAGSSELSLQQTNFDYGVNVLLGRLPLYTGDLVGSLFLSAFNQIGQAVGQVTGQIQSTAGMIINLLTGSGTGSQIQNFNVRPMGGPVPNGGSANNTPAYAWIPLSVPPNAVSMSFDFMLQGNGNNDSFQVALNGTNVLSLETVLIQTNVTLNSGLIDVSQYAGTNVELFLGIVGGTSTNAQLTVSDIQFYSATQPSLLAQASGGNLQLSWPFSAQNFSLQTTTNLTDPNSWTALTNVPAIVNLQNAITNSISDGARFYRLKQ